MKAKDILIVIIILLCIALWLGAWYYYSQLDTTSTVIDDTHVSEQDGSIEITNTEWNQQNIPEGSPVIQATQEDYKKACQDVVRDGSNADIIASERFYIDYLHAISLSSEDINWYAKVLTSSDCSDIDESNRFFCEKLQWNVNDLKKEDFKEDVYPYYLIKSVLSGKNECTQMSDEGLVADCTNTLYVFNSIWDATSNGRTEINFDFESYRKYLNEKFLDKCTVFANK